MKHHLPATRYPPFDLLSIHTRPRRVFIKNSRLPLSEYGQQLIEGAQQSPEIVVKDRAPLKARLCLVGVRFYSYLLFRKQGKVHGTRRLIISFDFVGKFLSDCRFPKTQCMANVIQGTRPRQRAKDPQQPTRTWRIGEQLSVVTW